MDFFLRFCYNGCKRTNPHTMCNILYGYKKYIAYMAEEEKK